MKITSSFHNINNSKQVQALQKVLPERIVLPEAVGEIAKRAGNYISTPEQKLFLAVSTLMLTPFWDLKYAEEDKKIDTAIKSGSKAIAGGITGVTIRAGFQGLTKKLINSNTNNFFRQCFFPRSANRMITETPELARIRLDQYSKTIGTFFAVLFMIFFSNSKMDVPLTSDIQDLLSGVIKDKKTWISSLADVSENRKDKINFWMKKKKNKLINIKNKIENIIKIINEDDTGINQEAKK